MKLGPRATKRQFDARLKSGVSNAKLVELELNLARPESSNGPFLTDDFTGRVFFPVVGLNGCGAIRKVPPASQQRVRSSGLKTFPPAMKSGLSPGERYTGERLWCVIRRASQSSLKSYPIDIGYGALTEQARMAGRSLLLRIAGYGSVAGITEQAHKYSPKPSTSLLLWFMIYSERLKDPRWKVKRKAILERDGYKCVSCGAERRSLEVHHIKYGPTLDPWDVDDSMLESLCHSCHGERHPGKACFNHNTLTMIESSLPPMPDVSTPGARLDRLKALCAALQRYAGKGSFYLSLRDISRFVGTKDPYTARNMVSYLISKGVLECVEKGTPAGRKASRYTYKL